MPHPPCRNRTAGSRVPAPCPGGARGIEGNRWDVQGRDARGGRGGRVASGAAARPSFVVPIDRVAVAALGALHVLRFPGDVLAPVPAPAPQVRVGHPPPPPCPPPAPRPRR